MPLARGWHLLLEAAMDLPLGSVLCTNMMSHTISREFPRSGSKLHLHLLMQHS